MLLSTFSHYSALHIFANMYVLQSFSTGWYLSYREYNILNLYKHSCSILILLNSPSSFCINVLGAVLMMGKEQFVGFYMAAGVVSSLASYACKVALNKPGFSLGAVSCYWIFHKICVFAVTAAHLVDLICPLLCLSILCFEIISTSVKELVGFRIDVLSNL